MQNSVITIRINSLYVSQPSSVFFACKTAWLPSELLVSMGPSPHVWFLDVKQRLLDQNYKSLWDPDLTCRFVHAKQRLLYQNNLSLWAPALICCFFIQNSDFWAWITSLYLSQTSPVAWCMHNGVICTRMTSPYEFLPSPVVLCSQNGDHWTRITNLYGFHTSPVVLSMQYNVISTRMTCLYWSQLLVSMGPSPHLWFLHANQRLLDQKCMSLWVPELTCDFLHAKYRA